MNVHIVRYEITVKAIQHNFSTQSSQLLCTYINMKFVKKGHKYCSVKRRQTYKTATNKITTQHLSIALKRYRQVVLHFIISLPLDYINLIVVL